MKTRKMILSLLMIVMLFITAALPVAADTILTTNDGTVLVCDDYGNCQIIGQVNNETNNNFISDTKNPDDFYFSETSVDLITTVILYFLLGIILIFLGGFRLSISYEPSDQFFSILVMSVGFALIAMAILELIFPYLF